jgi:hypothetical protein
MTKMLQDRREPGASAVVTVIEKVVRLAHGVSPSGWRQELRRDQWYGHQVAVWLSSVQDGSLFPPLQVLGYLAT